MALWLPPLPHSKKILSLPPPSDRGLCMSSLRLHGFSRGTPASSTVQRHAIGAVKLIGDSKLAIDVKVSATGCLSLSVISA